MEASTPLTHRRERGASPRLRSLRRRLSGADRSELAPPVLVGGLVLAFIAISWWWVHADARLPNGDNGKHLLIAFGYRDVIAIGHPLSPFAQYNLYPPLVHYVAAVGMLFTGVSEIKAIMWENVVFVPLLALGCYGAGTRVAGRWAGTLAAVFAFATPMIGSLFHVFMLDGPTTAMVAVTVWALLATERFSHTNVCALAGLAAGIGMYSKSTFPLFIFGMVAVMMLRGGWRRWRGWLTFGGLWFLVCAPWYLYHWTDLRGQTEGAAVGVQPFWYGNVPYPSRFSLDNFTWYGWNLVNNQIYLPLAIFLLLGVVLGIWTWARRRGPDQIPELLGGAAVSYVAISFITLDDPRYTLPGLIYGAVLATAWIVRLRPSLRTLFATALVAILVFNTLALNFNVPAVGAPTIHLPGAIEDPIATRELRVASTYGYIEGQPSVGPFTLRKLLERAHADGARQVVFNPESLNTGGYNLNGLLVFARSAGLRNMGNDPSYIVKKSQIYIFRTTPTRKLGKACIMSPIIDDGTGFFIQWGPTPKHGQPDIHCPR